MTKPLIHYIWVGPAPAIKNSGMDTVGPDLMRQNDPEQDIHFYCFDSEVGRYQAYFDQRHAGKKSIVVHGIESYVDKVDVIFYPKDKMKYIGSPFKKPILSPLPDENLNLKLEFQSFIKKLKDRAESFDNAKDKVREWITIKASFDFFIQIYESGFVLDTNVIPDFITRRPIKVPEGFACTYWFNSRGQENPDANIMYNPVADEAALIRFANYFYGVSLFLPFCESGEQSFPQESVQMLDKIDGNPTVRLMISDQFTRHGDDAIRLIARDLTPGKGYGDLRCTEYGLHKRYNHTHKSRGLDDAPILHRILMGSHSLEELEYFLEKAVDMDTYKPYLYIDQALIFRGSRLVETTSLIDVAQSLQLWDELALLLCFTKNPDALKVAINSSNTNCLKQFFLKKINWFDSGEGAVISGLNALISLLAEIFPQESALRKIDSLDQLIALLMEGNDNHLLKAVQLFIEKGPVTSENIESYSDHLAILYQKNSQSNNSPRLFKEKNESTFDLTQAKERLADIVGAKRPPDDCSIRCKRAPG